MKIPTTLAGVAGEYFVAAELSRRGYIASISLRNTRGVDMLATNAEATRSVTLQCKTRRAKGKEWMLNEKCENFVSETHFYVFIELGELLERPKYHIVPSREVAKFSRNRHLEWISKPKRDGSKRKSNSLRGFSDKADNYLEKWEFLGL